MYFQHAPEIWRDFPELAVGVVYATGITPDVDVAHRATPWFNIARQRLDGKSESDLPEIQAWHRTFSKMGLKPTQYRSASESLLRRFRKEGELPGIHPLIDICNALSLALAIPIAVFDLARVRQGLEVRRADGSERYLTFGGDIEHPEPGEVIFADAEGQAHARRWTNRQSGLSAIRESTTNILIVAEALHESAAADIAKLIEAISTELQAIWSIASISASPTAAQPRFEFAE